MKIIVTGGCGFIGSNLVEKLVTKGHSVTVFDDLSTGKRANINGLNVKLVTQSYTQIASYVPQADVIFHFGIPSSSPMYKRRPKLIGKAINDAIDVFEYAKTRECKVVYASSSSMYNGNKVPYREDMNIYVMDYYTECRFTIERLAELYSKLYGMKSVGLRFFSVYGPKEIYKGSYANLISQFLWAMRKDEQPVIFGDGTQTRDFTYVSDVVDASILAMNSDFRCEIFNVGTGVAYSLNQLVEILNHTIGKNLKPVYTRNPIKNYVQHTQADTTKAETGLGFKAKTPLRKGVNRLIHEEKIKYS